MFDFWYFYQMMTLAGNHHRAQAGGHPAVLAHSIHINDMLK